MVAQRFDAVAVQQDAMVVHALATRAFDDVDMHDPAVAVLAVWAAEIDAGLDESIRFEMPHKPSRGSSSMIMPTIQGRRPALIAGSMIFALVASGGAAAAVTGDPLAMVRAPLHALGKVNPFADDAPNARERLPEQAPATASANKLLADAGRAMARGQVAKAQRLLNEATDLLGEDVNPGQQNRIDKLMGDLPGQSGSQQGPNQGPKGPNGPQGKAPVDKPVNDPQGKAPVDKPVNDPQGKAPVDKPVNDPQGNGPVDQGTNSQLSGQHSQAPTANPQG